MYYINVLLTIIVIIDEWDDSWVNNDVEPEIGIKPTTFRLLIRCITIELTRLVYWAKVTLVGPLDDDRYMYPLCAGHKLSYAMHTALRKSIFGMMMIPCLIKLLTYLHIGNMMNAIVLYNNNYYCNWLNDVQLYHGMTYVCLWHDTSVLGMTCLSLEWHVCPWHVCSWHDMSVCLY